MPDVRHQRDDGFVMQGRKCRPFPGSPLLTAADGRPRGKGTKLRLHRESMMQEFAWEGVNEVSARCQRNKQGILV